jgi:hypothetical protein
MWIYRELQEEEYIMKASLSIGASQAKNREILPYEGAGRADV